MMDVMGEVMGMEIWQVGDQLPIGPFHRYTAPFEEYNTGLYIQLLNKKEGQLGLWVGRTRVRRFVGLLIARR